MYESQYEKMENVEMCQQTLLLAETDIITAFQNNESIALDLVEQAFIKRNQNDVLLPDKISQIFDKETQNRINCMPATLVSDKVCGVKWVAVFPNNPAQNLRNVTGTIILSELEHGFTLSVMDGTYITGLRTAAVGAVAAKYLAKEKADTIGFIGAGKEARRHLDMIKIARPSIKTCYVSSRHSSTVDAFIAEEQNKHPDMTFIHCCDDFKAATELADIIVTATSSQAALLKAEWIKKGALYIHVGGWEDEYAVAQKANKIVCDEWNSVKHRTQTISLMYKEGLLSDSDIHANLGSIVSGEFRGRENDSEFIYFCSVGLAYIDVMFAKYAYDTCKKLGLGIEFSLQ